MKNINPTFKYENFVHLINNVKKLLKSKNFILKTNR
jgi:hypothetical protein